MLTRARSIAPLIAGAMLTALIAAECANADPAAAPTAAGAARSADYDSTLAYYPPDAHKAGVDGEAVIRCARNNHLAVRDCTLVSETPAGKGFGAAALAMAAKSPDNPKVDLPEAATQPPAEIHVRFASQASPAVQPDLTGMAHLVGKPQIITEPTQAQIQAAYPQRALSDQIRGGAAIDCTVTLGGGLSECRVAGEAPSGYGFGQAAMDLAGDYKMKPRMLDGVAVGGAEVRVTVAFVPNDPTAPLSLDTKPAP